MLNIRTSDATDPSGALRETPRKGRENNLQWLKRQLDGGGSRAAILLLGGTDTLHFRLRIAQAHLRHDFSPSAWSHVALVGAPAGDIAKTPVHEVALDPAGGFGFPPPRNAVQTGTLGIYRDARRFPNVALLHLPLERKDVETSLERFKMQRTVLDTAELVLVWLAFAWGVGRTGNPLFDGLGVPSAAMLDVVLGAVGFDLTPGLESRASCPEAIWQAMRWWHGFYETQRTEAPSGAWTAPHALLPD